MELTEEHEKCECWGELCKTNICMPNKCHIIHEDTLDLFEFYKQKAEEYDKLSLKINNRIKQLEKQIENGECDILERVNIGELLKFELKDILK